MALTLAPRATAPATVAGRAIGAEKRSVRVVPSAAMRDWTMVTVVFRNWRARTCDDGERMTEIFPPLMFSGYRETVERWAESVGTLHVSAIGRDHQAPEEFRHETTTAVVVVQLDTDKLAYARQTLHDAVGPEHLGAIWWMPAPAMRAIEPDLPEGALRPRPEL